MQYDNRDKVRHVRGHHLFCFFSSCKAVVAAIKIMNNVCLLAHPPVFGNMAHPRVSSDSSGSEHCTSPSHTHSASRQEPSAHLRNKTLKKKNKMCRTCGKERVVAT